MGLEGYVVSRPWSLRVALLWSALRVEISLQMLFERHLNWRCLYSQRRVALLGSFVDWIRSFKFNRVDEIMRGRSAGVTVSASRVADTERTLSTNQSRIYFQVVGNTRVHLEWPINLLRVYNEYTLVLTVLS